jgi:Papain family cysteine protease/Ricin-type beta-trefoil lectin domain/Ricin-type beta-trefoil lectin domain-like
MKKITVYLTLILISSALHGQKISHAKKEQLFKTPAFWQAAYQKKLMAAPVDAAEKIKKFNAEAAVKGYTFRMAYTSVFGKQLASVTGGLTPDRNNPATFPDASYSNMPLRSNRVILLVNTADNSADMRDFGIVTPVRNQGGCGSCWAFAAMASFETATLLKNGGDAAALNLSEQQVVSCTGIFNSCGGGFNNDAVSYICRNNVAEENAVMYTAMNGTCGASRFNTTYRGRRWGWVGNSISEIKQAIVDHGSVATALWFSDELLAYGGGVYNLHNPPTLLATNHVVQIVGWNDALQAWLIKNSHGESWGEGGFGWIKYNINHIGFNCTWVEAEEFGDMGGVTNNPFQNNTNTVNFETAAYNTLEALYTQVNKYRIASRPSGKVIDCDDPVIHNANKGRRIIQWRPHNRETLVSSDGFNQEWFFIQAGKVNEKPVYKIFNHGFNRFLTDNNSGKPVCEDGNNQQSQLWYIMPQGSRTEVKIKNVASGRFIETPRGNHNDGAEVLMAAETAETNQLFDLSITAYNPGIMLDAKYFLVPKFNTGLALDVPAGNVSNGTPLQVWQKMRANDNQLWALSSTGDARYFRVHPVLNRSKCLEVLNISMDNNARAGLWDGWGGRNQDWLVIRIARENDKFIFFNRNSGKCLDVYASQTANGTAVHQWEFINAPNQAWLLERVN